MNKSQRHLTFLAILIFLGFEGEKQDRGRNERCFSLKKKRGEEPKLLRSTKQATQHVKLMALPTDFSFCCNAKPLKQIFKKAVCRAPRWLSRLSIQLGFGSCHDLVWDHGISQLGDRTHVGLCTGHGACLGFSLTLSLSLSLPLPCPNTHPL